MNPKLNMLAISLASALTLCASGVAWYGLSTPPIHHLPLNHTLIDATTSEGQQLLTMTAAKTDYQQLAPFFVSQNRRAFCGVASSTIVINAALHQQPLVTQATFFTPKASAIRSELAVTFGGLTLAQLGKMIEAHGLHVQMIPASQSSLATFRHIAQTTLAEPDEFLIVNYDRATLVQEGSGHISPIGAYNAVTDRVLILDVAANKYPYTWVPVPQLWQAMNTIDTSSGLTRGYLLVRAPQTQQP